MDKLAKSTNPGQLMKNIQTGNLQVAEAEFNALSLAEQTKVVEESGFNAEIILLAEDATPVMSQMAPQNALRVFDQTAYGESPLLECATPEQYLYILDHLVWTRTQEPKEGALPRDFVPGNGFDWFLGIKDASNKEYISKIFEKMGADLLYCFLQPHVSFTGTIVSLTLEPSPSELNYKMKPYGQGKFFTDGDIEALVEKVHEIRPDIFSAFCKKVAAENKPAIAEQYYIALERNGWNDIASDSGKESIPIVKEVDVDIELDF